MNWKSQLIDLDSKDQRKSIERAIEWWASWWHSPGSYRVITVFRSWMYWSDWGVTRFAQIERSGMDGSHRQVLVDTHLKWPNGITLDYEEKRLYWADAKLNTIASCRFDGSQRRVIISWVCYVYSFAYLHGFWPITFFWPLFPLARYQFHPIKSFR